jgi:hypothetical protein
MIKGRLDLDAVTTPGSKGQFDISADGDRIATRGGNFFTRSFGLGYPDLDDIVTLLETRLGSES